MSFQPVIVGQGLAAWALLKKTAPDQIALMSNGGAQKRRSEHFAANFGQVETAGQLMRDRQLATVALGAFDLLDDLGSTYFITRVLQEGIASSDALANKLQDSRYRSLASMFSSLGSNGGEAGTTGAVIDRYHRMEFERAVGEQNQTFRIAMTLERALPELAMETKSDDAMWFKVLGTPSLRSAFEGVFGLPQSFSQLDLDRQLETLKDRSASRFGTDNLHDLTETRLDDVIQTYLLQSQLAEQVVARPHSIALQLLGH